MDIAFNSRAGRERLRAPSLSQATSLYHSNRRVAEVVCRLPLVRGVASCLQRTVVTFSPIPDLYVVLRASKRAESETQSWGGEGSCRGDGEEV